MKAAPFEYVRPDTLAEACRLIASDEGARLIAGGQTLVPMMAMRLARPTRLVDIARLPELMGIRIESDAVVVGAAVRQAVAEHDPLVRSWVPLLAKALPWVGHQPTRSRGTIGGSIANADPSAEIPLVAVTLGATIEVTSTVGTREMAAEDFFLGPMVTAIESADCVSAVRFPIWRQARAGSGFREVSARRSDFAIAAAAAQVALDEDGRIIAVALGIGGVGAHPLRIDADGLVGGRGDDSGMVEDMVRKAISTLDANSDVQASADYRKRVGAMLAGRVVSDACAEAEAQ